MYIVGFNGPPRSGKNTLGNALQDRIALDSDIVTIVMSLSDPMGKAAAGMLGVEFTEEWYEREKDRIQPALGVTLRAWIIANSESFMKPTYGNDIWVKLFWESIPPLLHDIPCVIIVVNFGFEHEPEFFESKVGADNVVTVQVERPEHDYRNDSRGPVGGQLTTRVQNDGNEDSILVVAGRIYGRLVNQYGWKL